MPEIKRMPDIFDEIELDVFDDIELPDDERIAYSGEMKKVILEEVRNEITKIPIGKFVSSILEKEVLRQSKENEKLKKGVGKQIDETKETVKEEIKKIKDEEEKFMQMLKEKYAEIRNEIGQPKYTFGGFPQQFDLVNIGTIINFGPPEEDGSWRLRKDGSTLYIEYRSSGTWVEEGAFTATTP
jgi:hypothetical protein